MKNWRTLLFICLLRHFSFYFFLAKYAFSMRYSQRHLCTQPDSIHLSMVRFMWIELIA